ncbi:hypothetical protein C2G38_2325923 [Gigaspora rosea]|uniref:Uncharacterized protein n=1 Tax=Gigaspora rosea TaxID=44941 RepID=A0A397UUB9_9GLOM|nr:hypothetical protein C2G38_2325923 [Gigaspora rosea]
MLILKRERVSSQVLLPGNQLVKLPLITRRLRVCHLEGDDIDAESQETDGKIREEFAARFLGKGKVESVPVDIFLSGLGNLEKKLDKSFTALHNEIEEGEVLDATWPKVRLLKPRDQHEYDFLTKVGRCLDRAIRMLSSSPRKDFVDIRDEVEARAITLRLAKNKDSKRGETYKKGKRKDRGGFPFRGKDGYGFLDRRETVMCFNCSRIGYISSGCPSSGSKAPSKSRVED